MGFKRFLAGFNAGGAKIDAVLNHPVATPGGAVTGVVNIVGGSIPLDIQSIRLDLEAEVEVETDEGEHRRNVKFGGLEATPPMQLAAGQNAQVPFQLPVPWETPISLVYGRHLDGMKIGVRTQLRVAKSVDPGDLDPLDIAPLPSQQGILDAMGQLGFQFKKADLEAGTVNRFGAGQDLPFYQEIEFYPAPQFQGKVNEVEVTLLTNAHEITVVIEVDRRGGLLRSGHDAMIKFTIPHAQAQATDFRGILQHHINEKASGLGWFG